MEFELFFQFQSRFGFKFYLISFHFIHPLSFWGNIAYLFNITLFKIHYTRPDGDNLIKMIKDVMTQLGYWNDDAQVYSETIERFYGDVPGVLVRIEVNLDNGCC